MYYNSSTETEIKLKKIEQQLQDYSLKLNLHNTITIEELITSHNHLRNEQIKKRELINKEINIQVQQQIKSYITSNYIDKKELFKLTLLEICDKYYENECSS